MGTRGYVLKKTVQALLTLFAVVIFNFFLFRVLPADPIDLLTRGQGLRLSAADKVALRHEYGLDRPVFPDQLVIYVEQTFEGNLGTSIILDEGRKVTSLFAEFAVPTLVLVGISTILSTIFGILMGIYGGWRRGGKFDMFAMGFSLILYLLSNALRHTPPGGRIDVRTSVEGEHVVLEVLDTGPGIAAEDLAHVFERFYRGAGAEASSGSGIGLAVAAELIAAHDGTIQARNLPEGGAAFTVRLPAS